jgi:hypothetical protein
MRRPRACVATLAVRMGAPESTRNVLGLANPCRDENAGGELRDRLREIPALPDVTYLLSAAEPRLIEVCFRGPDAAVLEATDRSR